MKNFFIAASICCLSPVCLAQFAQVEGEFYSKSVELRTILLDPESGTVAASTSVVAGACSGTIAGVGRVSGKILTFRPHKQIEGGENCSITAQFDAKWKQVKITGEGCSAYHGASCAWEGQVAKRNQGRSK